MSKQEKDNNTIIEHLTSKFAGIDDDNKIKYVLSFLPHERKMLLLSLLRNERALELFV